MKIYIDEYDYVDIFYIMSDNIGSKIIHRWKNLPPRIIPPPSHNYSTPSYSPPDLLPPVYSPPVLVTVKGHRDILYVLKLILIL